MSTEARLAEALKLIDRLREELAERDRVVEERDRLIEQRDRTIEELSLRVAKLEKNSRNSSKPPSSDITKPSAEDDAVREAKLAKQRERRQKNAAKKRKKDARKKCTHSACPLPQGRVDEVLVHELPPEELRRRHAEPIPGAVAKLQRAELVDRPVHVTEHHVQLYRDTRTDKQLPAVWPDHLADGRLLGPRMVALTSTLKAELHGSYESIRTIFEDVFDLEVSTGTLTNTTHRLSEALAGNHAELLDAIQAEAVVNVDETGHKENGERPMTWAATTPDVSVFLIADTRSSEELYHLLGHDFDGVIGSDHFSAYLKYVKDNPKAEHQFCWAHLIRDILFTEKLTTAGAHDWFLEVEPAVKLLFHGWHRADPLICEEAKRRILAACREEREIDCKEVRRLQRRVRNHVAGYFRFLEDPDRGIEPTNNAAERVLRKLVMHRAVTQGTRGERGRRWWERVFSVRATLRSRGKSLFTHLVKVAQAAAAKLEPPPVLAGA